MSNTGGPRPPTTTATIIDPKVLKAIEEVKADTEAILAAMENNGTSNPAENKSPRYFPQGYFP